MFSDIKTCISYIVESKKVSFRIRLQFKHSEANEVGKFSKSPFPKFFNFTFTAEELFDFINLLIKNNDFFNNLIHTSQTFLLEFCKIVLVVFL
jgi:hypothetical protein